MIFMYRIDLLPDGCFVLTTHHKFPLKSVKIIQYPLVAFTPSIKTFHHVRPFQFITHFSVVISGSNTRDNSQFA